MHEIRHGDDTTVSRLQAAALADFAWVVRRFNNEPTVANFERYRIAARRLDVANRLLAGAEWATREQPEMLGGLAA